MKNHISFARRCHERKRRVFFMFGLAMLSQRGESMTNDEIRKIVLNENLAVNETIMNRIFDKDSVFNLRHIVSRNGENRYFIAYFDGMVDNQIIDLNIIRPLTLCDGEVSPEAVAQRVITTDTFNITEDLSKACAAMIQGDTLIFIDGYKEVISASSKGYKTRGVDEPDSEKNLRGPREGFTESIIANTALLRRCLLSPDLKMDMQSVTTLSDQKICLCYLDSLVDKNVLERLKKRLSRIHLKTALSANYIEEYIRDSRYSPFKTVGMTEKPDIAAAKILEGRIIILVDGTPSVLSVPFLLLEYFQSGNDYYSNFWLGSAQRLLRIVGVFLSVSVPAIYISLICFHQEMLPVKLLISVASSREGVPLSAVLELFVMLAAFELLNEAGIMMPQGIGNALSTVGGVVIGQAAVDARFISAPLVIVVAFTGLTDLMVPKMKEAMLVTRLFLLTLSAIVGLYGYIIGVLFILAMLISMNSFGVPYTSFIATWKLEDMRDTGLRAPLWMLHKPSVRENEGRTES